MLRVQFIVVLVLLAAGPVAWLGWTLRSDVGDQLDVNADADSTRVVPRTELQNKSDRPYVIESLKLAGGACSCAQSS